jgi:AcrR family transcriptional regulator
MARGYRMVARAEAIGQTRQRVIDAALELFSQRPFDLVSLSDVARASGIGLATVVRQFGSKDQLFAVTIAQARSVLEGSVAEPPADDPAAAVRGAIAGYERFGDAIVRLVAQEDRVPAIRAITERGRREHERWVRQVFASALSPLRGKERKLRFAQLMAATDVQFWKLLRRDLRLSRSDAVRAITDVVEALCR